MAMAFPLKGAIYYEIEASYKAGFSGTQSRFSDSVDSVRIETGDVNQELWNIGSHELVDFQLAFIDPALHIEYSYQPHTGTPAVAYMYERTNCDLDSFAIEVGVNVCSGSVVSTWYYMTGCKCKSFTVSASKGELYKISADFSVGTLTVSNSATGTDPGAIGTAYAAFNTAGSITWAGVTGAYVTEAFEFTVNNNLTDYNDVGSTAKKASIPGKCEITGSCDISLDDGGDTHFGEVLAGTDITSVKLDSGLATGSYGEFELDDGRFDSTNITYDVGGGGVITSVPFTFTSLTFNAGTP